MSSPEKNQVETIGSVEVIDLPKLSIYGIPAKIDTGAESSSIWASAVKLKKGILEFKLFAPGSAFYTGKTIRTKDFNTAIVRNSFGTKEYRYKVNFSASLGPRRIRASFTLADRSGMSYPVLLGRNTLRKKFVVDVSQLKLHGSRRSKRKILIVSAKPKDNEQYFKRLGRELKNNATFSLLSYKDLAFFIKTGHVRVIETETNRDIGNFDVVYFKFHRNDSPIAVSAAQYLQFKGTKFFDKELLSHIAYDKLAVYMKLALHNLPIPYTICASQKYLLKNINDIGKQTGWPLVCKEINSDRGRKNWLVDNKAQLKKILKAASPDETYIVQTYIPNKGWLRALVFGKAAELFIQREPTPQARSAKRHLNKPGGSVNARLLEENEINSLARDLAIKAADLTSRQIAGVDLIQNTKNKKWLILEVNNSPQIRSGAFVAEKAKMLAKFIDFELNR